MNHKFNFVLFFNHKSNFVLFILNHKSNFVLFILNHKFLSYFWIINLILSYFFFLSLRSSSNSIAQVDTIKVRCVHSRSSCKRVRYLESVLVSVEYSYSGKYIIITFYDGIPLMVKKRLKSKTFQEHINWTFISFGPCFSHIFIILLLFTWMAV